MLGQVKAAAAKRSALDSSLERREPLVQQLPRSWKPAAITSCGGLASCGANGSGKSRGGLVSGQEWHTDFAVRGRGTLECQALSKDLSLYQPFARGCLARLG